MFCLFILKNIGRDFIHTRSIPTDQNQIYAPDTSNCNAKTPPPFWLKPSPKLLGLVSATAHPVLPAGDPLLQSVLSVRPLCPGFGGCTQDESLWCSAIWLFVIRLTPSTMSISPNIGHSKSVPPKVQKAGQTCSYGYQVGASRKRLLTCRTPIWHVNNVYCNEASQWIEILRNQLDLQRNVNKQITAPLYGPTELRSTPVPVISVELSTLKIALPASLTYASLFAVAVAWSTNMTLPAFGTLVLR